MAVTHVTHVTRISTFKDYDTKHSLLNRVEKLRFWAKEQCFFNVQYMWENASHASHASRGNDGRLVRRRHHGGRGIVILPTPKKKDRCGELNSHSHQSGKGTALLTFRERPNRAAMRFISRIEKMTDKTDQTAHLTHLMGIEVDRVDRFFGDAVAELERDGGSVRFFNAALIGRAMRATLEAEGPEALARAVQRFGDAAIIAANPKGRA